MALRLLRLPSIVYKRIVEFMDPVSLFCLNHTSKKVARVLKPFTENLLHNRCTIEITAENNVTFRIKNGDRNTIATYVAHDSNMARLQYSEVTVRGLNLRWYPEGGEDGSVLHVHCINVICGAVWMLDQIISIYRLRVTLIAITLPVRAIHDRIAQLVDWINDMNPQECIWYADGLTPRDYFFILEIISISGNVSVKLRSNDMYNRLRTRERKEAVKIRTEQLTLENAWWLTFEQLMTLTTCKKLRFTNKSPFPAQSLNLFLHMLVSGSHSQLESLRIGRVESVSEDVILEGVDSEKVDDRKKLFTFKLLDGRIAYLEFNKMLDTFWDVILNIEKTGHPTPTTSKIVKTSSSVKSKISSSKIIRPDVRNPNGGPPRRTIFGILSNDGFQGIRATGRLQIGKTFENPIPEGNGKDAQERGPWQSKFSYPGIPTKKFTESEEGSMEKGYNWVIQNIYRASDDTCYVVTYEGWNTSASYELHDVDFERKYETYVNEAKIRDDFLRIIKGKRSSTDEMKRFADRWLSMQVNLLKSTHHKFWCYEDLSYYHSRIQLDYGLPSISYMCLKEKMVDPPKFKYTTFNIVTEPAFMEISRGKFTKPYVDVKRSTRKTKVEQHETPCETPDTCKCNKVFDTLYSASVQKPKTETFNMVPDKNGLLDVSKFDKEQLRIVVECSDACGCSEKCPRRRLQQGQTKRIIVFYENSKIGFGLRAAEKIRVGEFLFEYCGIVRTLDDDEGRVCSYDAGLALMRAGKKNNTEMVIDSSEVGNISRFLSHACSPSAAFFESHSRLLQSDSLIPRIAVYALKDIAIGEAVSISYYQEYDLTGGKGIPCGCRPGCPNHLPK